MIRRKVQDIQKHCDKVINALQNFQTRIDKLKENYKQNRSSSVEVLMQKHLNKEHIENVLLAAVEFIDYTAIQMFGRDFDILELIKRKR